MLELVNNSVKSAVDLVSKINPLRRESSSALALASVLVAAAGHSTDAEAAMFPNADNTVALSNEEAGLIKNYASTSFVVTPELKTANSYKFSALIAVGVDTNQGVVTADASKLDLDFRLFDSPSAAANGDASIVTTLSRNLLLEFKNESGGALITETTSEGFTILSSLNNVNDYGAPFANTTTRGDYILVERETNPAESADFRSVFQSLPDGKVLALGFSEGTASASAYTPIAPSVGDSAALTFNTSGLVVADERLYVDLNPIVPEPSSGAILVLSAGIAALRPRKTTN